MDGHQRVLHLLVHLGCWTSVISTILATEWSFEANLSITMFSPVKPLNFTNTINFHTISFCKFFITLEAKFFLHPISALSVEKTQYLMLTVHGLAGQTDN